MNGYLVGTVWRLWQDYVESIGVLTCPPLLVITTDATSANGLWFATSAEHYIVDGFVLFIQKQKLITSAEVLNADVWLDTACQWLGWWSLFEVSSVGLDGVATTDAYRSQVELPVEIKKAPLSSANDEGQNSTRI